MSLKSSELPHMTDGIYLQFLKDLDISFLSTDSRKTVMNPSSLFFAIKGLVHDGHEYISELYANNVRQYIIEDPNFDVSPFPDGNFLLVDQSKLALQKIARWHRQKFNLPVIGITGSNGKTIVKEWLSQLLSWKLNVIKTPKSFNSQIGVPLSIWQIQDYHNIGVFEAGISKTGEMSNLRDLIQPSIGILTNIGPAHDEGFNSKEDKLIEKLKLFSNVEKLIYRADENLIRNSVDHNLPDTEKVSWGTHGKAKYQVTIIKKETNISVIIIRGSGLEYAFSFPFIDEASIENITHAIVCLIHLGWGKNQIQEGLYQLSRISMRLEMKKGINDCYIIDDSYSNDLAGLEIALNYLHNQYQRNMKSIILTDILQSGMSADELYHKTSSLLNHFKLNKIIAIGKEIEKIRPHIKHSLFHHYQDIDTFFEKYPVENFSNEIILIKGARKFGLEKVVQKLQEKIHGTVLEINLDALSHNLNIYRSYLNPEIKIMVMVKALAYGSGSIEVANLLEFHRIDYLGVAYIDEAITLRKNGISLPIMIMNPSADAFEKIVDFRLEPEIYNLRLLNEISSYTQIHEENIKIHIKIDTGMHRLGFQLQDLDEMIAIINSNSFLKVTSVFSHLAAADDKSHDLFTKEQARIFLSAIDKIKSKISDQFIIHLANSAAINRFPQYHFDMVRLGIGLYGFDNTGEILDQLLPIGRLKTNISQIIHLKKGETVGYGRKGQIEKDGKIATIAIGYADGFSRNFSNGRLNVYINGNTVPVIGNVCMDMTMIDITGLNVKEGDEVVIFGKEMPLHHLAMAINTIPYEILTNVSERVKRVYVSE